MFRCGLHDFQTEKPDEWDKHCAEIEHEYDTHTPCAGKCGKKLHIQPKQKLSPEAMRSPQGQLCKECLSKMPNVPEIKEAGEVQ